MLTRSDGQSSTRRRRESPDESKMIRECLPTFVRFALKLGNIFLNFHAFNSEQNIRYESKVSALH